MSEWVAHFVAEVEGYEIIADEDAEGVKVWPIFPVGAQVSEFTARSLPEAIRWCEKNGEPPGPPPLKGVLA